MLKSKILFIMTGSIACYKACGLISKLVQNNYDVQVVATESALKFIGNSTIEGLTGKPVLSDLYKEGHNMEHISLMNWADMIVVAPATANYINKISAGLGDDLASTLFLAHDYKKPFLIAPAMNTKMYLNPITQKSIGYLKSLGIIILETASGVLACGEVGFGKLLDPELLFQEIKNNLNTPPDTPTQKSKEKTFRANKVLITAGGTIEPIDGVRSIINTSTGQTGSRIADFLYEMGLDVHLLISANSTYKFNKAFRTEEFTDFHTLNNSIKSNLANDTYDIFIHSAAVSDYSLEKVELDGIQHSPSRKIKFNSDADNILLHLKKNPKIVNSIKDLSKNKNIKLIAFKLTNNANHEEVQIAINKLFNASQADFIIHNDLSTINKTQNKHTFNVFKPNSLIAENITLDQLFTHLSNIVDKGESL